MTLYLEQLTFSVLKLVVNKYLLERNYAEAMTFCVVAIQNSVIRKN